MKKLLTLFLCVMLFASVVPTAAFADSINLKPAYDAMYSLYVAYARFSAAVAGKNAVEGAIDYAMLFDKVNNPNAHARANTWARTLGKQATTIVNNIGKKGYGLGLEGTWKVWGKNISLAYDRIGEGVILDAALAEKRSGNAALKGAAAELDKVNASITDAINTTMNTLYA